MSNFKKAVANDIKGVFLNLEEFADVHNINGNSLSCIVDTDITKEAGSGQNRTIYEGVFINAVTIYVKTEEMEARPVEGELLDLDGNTYIVRNVSDEMGMLAITAEANAQ